MSETPDRPMLRLLTFTPGRRKAPGRRKDIGLTLSSFLQDFRRQSPVAADKIERALSLVIVAELHRWADQREAETAGSR